MSAPLPDAVRARFQKLIEEGLSGRAAALRLKVSPATGARWGLAIRRTGQARAAPQGRPGGRGRLDPHRAFFAEIIAQDGDITMPELASALHDATGVRVHPSAIGKFLRKFGYTHKKSLVAAERLPLIAPLVRAAMATYQGKAAARRLVQASYPGCVTAPRLRCLY
jgi:transposase